MIRIAYLSDLHIDFTRDRGSIILAMIEAQKDNFDVLVIAGDVSNYATETFDFIRKAKQITSSRPGKDVIFVPGNHEYYNFEMPWVDGVLTKLDDLRVHVLRDGSSALTIFSGDDPYLFVGATMWTDFELFGNAPIHMDCAARSMSDFSRVVTPKGRILTPEDTVALFNTATENMRHQVMNRHPGSKVIAVSHHGPSWESVAEKYRDNALTPAFSSGLLDPDHPSYQSWTMLVDLWIHGHTHTEFDYVIDHGNAKTRVLCNPRGYPMPGGADENGEFSFKIVTL